MYKLSISVENPITGESRLLPFRFDPATFDESTWTAGFPRIRAAIDDLVAMDATADPRRPVDMASLPAVAAPV